MHQNTIFIFISGYNENYEFPEETVDVSRTQGGVLK